MTHTTDQQTLSRCLLLLMAIAVSATGANLFYNQPLLPSITTAFGLEGGAIGLIPAASQFGYAIAILMISPLGDTMDRRLLIRNLSIVLSLALFAVYLAPNFWLLVLASTVVGVGGNITQQLLPFAASLSTPDNRGKVIATLMTGLTMGILLSRTLSGSIAEYFGWRSVFLVAGMIAVVIGFLLYAYLPRSQPAVQLPYPKLIGSLFTLFKGHILLRESALSGALWFAAFNAAWATLAIHVSAEPFSYSVQQAGLFGIVGLAGIFGAKASGRLVNSVGPTRLITIALLFVLSSFVVLAVWGDSLAALIIGIVLLDLGVFGAQIPNQVRVFSIDPSAHSRINAVYMLCYFLGAAIGSAAGAKVMSLAGWHGLTLFGMALSVAALLHHLWRQSRKVKTVAEPLTNVTEVCGPTELAEVQREPSNARS